MEAKLFFIYYFALVELGVRFTSHAAKIVVVPIPWIRSHNIVMKEVAQELASRGHEVHFIISSTHKHLQIKNAKTSVYKLPVGDEIQPDQMMKDILPLAVLKEILSFLNNEQIAAESLLNKTDITNQCTGAELIVSDAGFFGAVFLADLLDVPRVEFHMSMMMVGPTHGVPSPLSYIPQTMSRLASKMTFLERVKNVLMWAMLRAVTSVYFHVHSSYFEEFKKRRNIKHGRSLQDSIAAAELVLVQTDFALEYARPIPPGVKLVGPLMPGPAGALNSEMEDFVSSSGDAGLIIVSFGSMVSALEPEVMNMLADTFAQLKQKVLWKVKGYVPPSFGSNTKMVEWFPQNDLLGHRKTRLFITHMGVNSMYEAGYHGIPVVAVPLFVDQFDNARKVEERGMGLSVDIHTTNPKDLGHTIERVLTEPQFKANAQRVSELLRDRRRTPLQEAGDWIEYVVRNKDISHFRPAVLDIAWYQYYLLDVIALLVAVVTFIVLLARGFAKYVCGLLRRKKGGEREKSKRD